MVCALVFCEIMILATGKFAPKTDLGREKFGGILVEKQVGRDPTLKVGKFELELKPRPEVTLSIREKSGLSVALLFSELTRELSTMGFFLVPVDISSDLYADNGNRTIHADTLIVADGLLVGKIQLRSFDRSCDSVTISCLKGIEDRSYAKGTIDLAVENCLVRETN